MVCVDDWRDDMHGVGNWLRDLTCGDRHLRREFKPRTLTVCPESGSVGSTVTIVGRGCSAGFVVFLSPGPYDGSGDEGDDIPVAPEASNDFAGTWRIPSTYYSGGNDNTPLPVKPSSDYQLQTSASGCHAPFGVTKGHP